MIIALGENTLSAAVMNPSLIRSKMFKVVIKSYKIATLIRFSVTYFELLIVSYKTRLYLILI